MRKPAQGNFVTKVFKTFALYIFVTLFMFFGYVQLFGDVKPPVLELPSGDAGAEDEGKFGAFVTNLMSLQNVVAEDVTIAFDGEEIDFSISGDAAFNLANSKLSCDLDLTYNGYTFDVGVVYVDPELYLTLENETYRFDLSAEFDAAAGTLDLTKVLGLVTKVVGIDTSFVDSIGDYLGIDFANLDMNALMNQLKIEEEVIVNNEKDPTDDQIKFTINFGSIIEAIIECDDQYNITSAIVRDIHFGKAGVVKVKLPSVEMNQASIADKIQIPTGDDIVDMTAATEYAGYASNLFANDFVEADATIKVGDKNYNAAIFYDSSVQPRIKIVANVEGIDVSVAYQNGIVYVDAEELKLSFDAEDFEKWETKLNQIFEHQTSKDVATFVKEYVNKLFGVEEGTDIKQEILNILGISFANVDSVNDYLPSSTQQTENSFVMSWDNSLNVQLVAAEQQLTQINVQYQNNLATITFVVADHGFDIAGQYYNLSNLLTVADVVDQVLTTQQVAGQISSTVSGVEVIADYVVDFASEIKVQISLDMLGEDIAIYANGNKIFVKIGEIVVEADVNEGESYLAKIDEVFETQLSGKLTDGEQIVPVEISAIVALVEEVLNTIKLYEAEGVLAVVEYMSHKATLSQNENVLTIDYANADIVANVTLSASEEEISIPTATDNMTDVLAKIENAKAYVEAKQYAFDLNAQYNNIVLNGTAYVDLLANKFALTGLTVGQNELSVAYIDGVAYIAYADLKLQIAVDNVMELVDVIMPIVEANGVTTSGEGADLAEILTKVFGEDVRDLTINAALEKIALALTGTMNNMTAGVTFNGNKVVSANATLTFADNKLATVNVNAYDTDIALAIVDFAEIEIEANEYYNLTTGHKGTVELTTTVDGEVVNVTTDIELLLNKDIYLNISTKLFGEDIEIIILNNRATISIGEVVVGTDFNNTKELVETISTTFEIAMGSSVAIDIEEMLETLDLNKTNVLDIAGLTLAIDGTTLSATYEAGSVKVVATLSDEQTVVAKELATNVEDLKDVVAKVENVREYVEAKQYAFDLNAQYNNIVLNGTAYVDLLANKFALTGLTVGQNELSVAYIDGVAYIAYADLKLQIAVDNVMELVDVIMPIVEANGVTTSGEGADLAEILTKVFGEDVRDLTINAALEKIALALTGTMNNMTAGVTFNGNKVVSANATLTFADNKLATVNVNAYDADIALAIVDFAEIEIEANEYYNLTTGHKGTVELTATVDGEVVNVTADVELLLNKEIYLKVSTTLAGEYIEIAVLNNRATISIGEVVVGTDFNNAKELVETISTTFGLVMGSSVAIDIEEMLETLDLNKTNVLDIAGLTLAIDGTTLSATYEAGSVKVVATLSDEQTVVAKELATNVEDLKDVVAKVENVREYVEAKQYAFDLNAQYNNIVLNGTAYVDLLANKFALTGLTVGQNELSVAYIDGVAYIAYADLKLQIAVDNVMELVDVIMPIVEANGVTTSGEGADLAEILTKVFGEDVRDLTINAALEKIALALTGTMNNMTAGVTFNGNKVVSANATLTFADNKLATVNVNAYDADIALAIVDFAEIEIEANEYYNLTTGHKGTVELTATVDGEVVNVTADIELLLNKDIYLNISTKLFGEDIEIAVLNNRATISIGEVVVGADFNNAKELVETISTTFGLVMGSSVAIDIEEMLETLDLNKTNVLDIAGLTLAIDGTTLSATYEAGSVKVVATLSDEQTVVAKELATNVEDLKDVVAKVENLKDYVEAGVYEFDFVAQYNGWEFEGALKYANDIVTITEMVVAGANVDIRLDLANMKVYFAYGNMKLAFDIPQGGESESAGSSTSMADILQMITTDELGVVIDFGVFDEIVDMLNTYKVSDYLDKILLAISGNADALKLLISNEKELSYSDILTVLINFVDNKFDSASISVYDILSANIIRRDVAESTITAIDTTQYTTDFVEAALDSLRVEEGVYAFSSDLAVRYSTNTFYGDLTLMMVYDETKEGMLGHYIPAVSLSTTALGFNTRIYLIDQTVYLDFNGLQLKGDLAKETLDEILTFAETQFGVSLGGETAAVTKATEAFAVLLPAIDQIYGAWIDTLGENGIQINIKDDLWYQENSRFYDMVIKANVEVLGDIVAPSEIVIGANIEDPNTMLYDDYSDAWLSNEDAEGNKVVFEQDITKDLNFAVYLTGIDTGLFVDALSTTFVGENYKDITALKSFYGTTALTDFNSYKTVLEMADAAYEYGVSKKYEIAVEGSISGASTTDFTGTNLMIELGDLPEMAEGSSAIDLFNSMYIKLQSKIDVTLNAGTANSVRHLASVYYESDNTNSLYATYAHGKYIGANDVLSDDLKVKFKSENLSEIVAMVLAALNVELGDTANDQLGLPEITTDFSYIQGLLGVGGGDVSGDVSEVDKALSSIENVAKMIKQLRLAKTEIGETGLYQTSLSASVEFGGRIAEFAIRLNEENTADGVVLKLREIAIANLAFGGSVANITLKLSDYSGNYTYNTSAEHIDFSTLSSVVDYGVNTLNARHFSYQGKINVNAASIVKADITFDLDVELDEKARPTIYAQFSLTKSLIAGVAFTGDSFDRRISILEYKDEQLSMKRFNIKQATEGGFLGMGGTKWNKITQDSISKSVYAKSEIGANVTNIIRDLFGFGSTVMDLVIGIIKDLNINPSLEGALLGYASNSSGYVFTLDGQNLLIEEGASTKAENLVVTLGKANYNGYAYGKDGNAIDKTYSFVSGIDTVMKLTGVEVSLDIDEISVSSGANGRCSELIKLRSSYNDTTSGAEYGNRFIYTNDYYRKNYIRTVGGLY